MATGKSTLSAPNPQTTAPIIGGPNVTRWAQERLAGLTTTVQSTQAMVPTAAIADPKTAPADGTIRLARAPWWPVAGQTSDAWVYYDAPSSSWQYLDIQALSGNASNAAAIATETTRAEAAEALLAPLTAITGATGGRISGGPNTGTAAMTTSGTFVATTPGLFVAQFSVQANLTVSNFSSAHSLNLTGPASISVCADTAIIPWANGGAAKITALGTYTFTVSWASSPATANGVYVRGFWAFIPTH